MISLNNDQIFDILMLIDVRIHRYALLCKSDYTVYDHDGCQESSVPKFHCQIPVLYSVFMKRELFGV